MKRATTSAQAAYGPLERKTFKASLIRELRLHIPTLGELTAQPLAQRIQDLMTEYFPSVERLRMGQVVWPAVDEKESGGYGKRIEQTRLKPVLLEVIAEQDVKDLLSGVSCREVRKTAAVRLFTQANDQGGVLTSVDVATMLRVSPATIGKYIAEHEKAKGKLVPRRGTVHDMGPTLTHKSIICRRVILEGWSIEKTARETRHSPEAVTRYVHDYRRVYECLKKKFSVEETAFATSMSKRLVKEYADLIDEQGLMPENGF